MALPGGSIHINRQQALTMVMRWNIEVRHQTGWPVLLVEEGRLVGVVGDREIYGGILRQSRMTVQEPDC